MQINILDQDKMRFDVEYMKSGLSVNTHVGCVLNCGYCVVSEFIDRFINKVSEPEELLIQIIEHKFFIKDKTPLLLNNRTDPLLSRVRKSTFDLVDLISSEGLENPVIIISKLSLKEDELSVLESLKNAYFIVSYSNLPRFIEPLSHDHQKRTFKVLEDRVNTNVLHYWRPIIAGLNDDHNNIYEVLSTVGEVSQGSIISGLRLNDSIYTKLLGQGVKIKDWDGDTQHKLVPPDFLQKVLKVRDTDFADYKIFKHTSCGISAQLNTTDYNLHFLRKNGCLPGCVNENNCYLPKKPSQKTVQELMDRLELTSGFKITEENILVDGVLSEEERTFIRQSLGFPVVPKKLTKSPSESVIRK